MVGVFFLQLLYIFICNKWCTVHIVVVWQFKSQDKLTENTWKIEKIPFRYQWNTFERSRQYPWKTRITPLKDQENTLERSRKCLWKKILLKTKKIPLKDQEQPGTLCGRQHGSFCWSHPLHLLFFKHYFHYVLEFFDSVVLLFDVSFHHSPRWVVFK